MLRKHANRRPAAQPSCSVLFAALGDETRLALLATLSSGQPRSISQLTRGTRLTRQAVAKHLRVLANAGMVRCVRAGRESLYEYQPQAIVQMHQYLESVSREWDQALSRLQAFVED